MPWLLVTHVCPRLSLVPLYQPPPSAAAAALACRVWVPLWAWLAVAPSRVFLTTVGSLRPSPHATSSEPRLYRKTFLLRKRGSKPNLQASSVPAIPGKSSDCLEEEFGESSVQMDHWHVNVTGINQKLWYLLVKL